MVVEEARVTGQELDPAAEQRDLFKLAYALGCPPVEIPLPEGCEDDGFRLYAIDFSKVDPEALGGPDGDDWEPVEDSPEEHAKRLEEGLAAVAEYEAEYGAFGPELEAWADAVLDSLGIGMDT